MSDGEILKISNAAIHGPKAMISNQIAGSGEVDARWEIESPVGWRRWRARQ